MGKAFAIGLVLVAIPIGAFLYLNQGQHMAPHGVLLKVRTQPIDDNHSLAVMDIRVSNESDVEMIVRESSVSADGAEGTMMAGTDAKTVFQYYPLLGEKMTEPLVGREHIRPRSTVDRMIVARFDVPESALAAKEKIVVRVEDVDGSVAVIKGK